MRLRTIFIALFAIVLGCGVAHAQIVDIDANLFSGVSVLLSAGTYLIEPIGPSDGGAHTAWHAWEGHSNCVNPAGCLQCGGGEGWLHRLRISSPLIVAATVGDVVVPPTGVPPCDSVDFLTFIGGTWRLQVQDGNVYPDAENALLNARDIVVQLSGDGLVEISVGDIDSGNNVGGMSVRISQPISVESSSFGAAKALYR